MNDNEIMDEIERLKAKRNLSRVELDYFEALVVVRTERAMIAHVTCTMSEASGIWERELEGLIKEVTP